MLTTAAGIVNVDGATLTKAAGGLGGAGGLAGPNGTRGELGPAALGAWTTAPNPGAQGGAVSGTSSWWQWCCRVLVQPLGQRWVCTP